MTIGRILVALAISGPLMVSLGGQRGGGQIPWPGARQMMVQDLGRDRNPDTILVLAGSLRDPDASVRREAAYALAHRLIGAAPGEPLKSARFLLLAQLQVERDDVGAGREMLRALGELPYDPSSTDYLLDEAGPRAPERYSRRVGAAEGLEALVRNGTMPPLAVDKVRGRLIELATPSLRPGAPEEPILPALQALQIAGNVPSATILALGRYHCRGAVMPTCGWQVRRIAAQMMDAADDTYADVLDQLVRDPAFQVRLEALRVLAVRLAVNNDCRPFVDALRDDFPVVSAAAYDLLDPRCAEKGTLIERLSEEAADLVDPYKKDAWFLPLHAYKALTRLAPEEGKNLLAAVVRHSRWPVRAAAARIAGQLRHEASAIVLAADAEPRVRIDAMAALRTLNSTHLENVGRQEFERVDTRGEGIHPPDVGSLATAASALRGRAQVEDLPMFLKVLAMPETARMAKLAVLDRIKELGKPDESGISLLKDHTREIQAFLGGDPPVSVAVADVIETITGRRPTISQAASSVPTRVTALPITEVLITMARGDQVVIDLQGNEAPATVARVLARIADPDDGYRGATFHRLLPNLLIQGGSRDGSDWAATPCETTGARRSSPTRPGSRGGAPMLRPTLDYCRFWTDELNPLRHERGAVALATNEPNTGIGQFFVDLVDTPAFNHRYTVFGKVACVKPARPMMQRTMYSESLGLYDPMDLIDHFVEGEEIRRVEVPKPRLDRKALVCR